MSRILYQFISLAGEHVRFNFHSVKGFLDGFLLSDKEDLFVLDGSVAFRVDEEVVHAVRIIECDMIGSSIYLCHDSIAYGDYDSISMGIRGLLYVRCPAFGPSRACDKLCREPSRNLKQISKLMQKQTDGPAEEHEEKEVGGASYLFDEMTFVD